MEEMFWQIIFAKRQTFRFKHDKARKVSSCTLLITHLLLHRIPEKITIQYRGKKTEYDVDWSSTVKAMMEKVMKKGGVQSYDMVLVHDRKVMNNSAQWYRTSILGKEDIILYICKR